MKRPPSPRSRSTLAALALFLAVAGCARRRPPEWKTVQSDFARLLSSGDLRGAAPVKAGIRERRAPMTGIVERCATCHLGAEEPALRDVEVPRPYRFHPDVPHAAKEMGCTTCHRGDATALASAAAHAGASPALPLRFTESSCGRCHLDRVVAEAPHLTEGRLLIARLGCAGCHEIPGFENERNTGYDLDGLGTKVNRAWLVKWLSDPKAYLPSTTMPAYRFAPPEIEALADFLLSSRDEKVAALADRVRQSAPSTATAARASSGEAAVARLGCASCHAFDGKGGRVGPDLGRSGAKLRPEWLLAWLKFPREFFAGGRMPQYSFPDREIVEITDYLVNGFADAALARSAPHVPASASVERGRRLFVSSGCVGCHNRSGVSRPAWLAPKLSGIGDKSALDLSFGAAKIERTLPSWLKAKVLTPHLFNPSLRMPDFQLAETEADDITTALLSLAEEVPERHVVRARAGRAPQPSKDVAEVLSKYRCLDCHTFGEKGQPLAMDLSRAGSKLNRAWLVSYLRKPYPIRPLVKERMPDFGISEKEIALLADFLESACVDPAIPAGPFASGEIPREEVERGRKLFQEEHGCRACHIVGGEGGVYGPSLNGAGSRMKAAWIYAWILSPKALDPATRTPDFGLTPEAARALTAYVASQRSPDAELRAQPERHLVVSGSAIPDEVRGGGRYEAEKGRAVYLRYCAFCHGESGRGDGPSVERLERAPTDFTRLPTMAKLRRADLVRAIASGGRGVGKSPLMPPYGRTLTAHQIDEVVTYLQTFTPLSARFKYSASLTRCEEMRARWESLERFATGAPADARERVATLRRELDAVMRDPSASRCEAFAARLEEERSGLGRQLEALLSRNDLDALARVLAALGKPAPAPPPAGPTWSETVEAYRSFNQGIQAQGRAAFAGRGITWEVWRAVHAGLRSGSFPKELRVHLPELERMGLVTLKVELPG